MASEEQKHATIIDGKVIAQTIRNEIASEVLQLSQKYNKVPGLAVVIVGNRKDSQSYVGMKRKACAEVGIRSFDIDLPEEVSEEEVVKKVHELNANADIHGILVQLPLPKHINEEKVLTEISIEKDVDGFHPLNIGKLAMKGREPLFQPCTPKGNCLSANLLSCNVLARWLSASDSALIESTTKTSILAADPDAALNVKLERMFTTVAPMTLPCNPKIPHLDRMKNFSIFYVKTMKGIRFTLCMHNDSFACPFFGFERGFALQGCLELLSRSGVSVKGKRAVVVGRSNIVGLPVSLLLLKADATVTIVHSCTPDSESIIRQADIIIAAAGQPMMIKGDWIKPGAAVIDVGTNAVDDPSRKCGYRLVGDVDFQEACKVAGYLTPVPGGVGPMTVAMLLKNTLEGAKRKLEQ